MSTVTPYLDRILDPLAGCLTPEVARRLLDLRADAQTEGRLNDLAAKANEGTLTPLEDAEYKQMIDAIDLVAVLQAKARTLLKRGSEG
jgi:hypothetical protein